MAPLPAKWFYRCTIIPNFFPSDQELAHKKKDFHIFTGRRKAIARQLSRKCYLLRHSHYKEQIEGCWLWKLRGTPISISRAPNLILTFTRWLLQFILYNLFSYCSNPNSSLVSNIRNIWFCFLFHFPESPPLFPSIFLIAPLSPTSQTTSISTHSPGFPSFPSDKGNLTGLLFTV